MAFDARAARGEFSTNIGDAAHTDIGLARGYPASCGSQWALFRKVRASGPSVDDMTALVTPACTWLDKTLPEGGWRAIGRVTG
jgi:hypothetical protein